MKIKQVAEALEKFAPLPLQESYDNAGLQIGLTEVEVSRVLLCLDVTEDVIMEAAEKGCQLIVSHHPLLFRGVKCVSDSDMVQRCVRLAIKHDIAIYSAHTNLDNAAGGVNWMIAEKLGLQNVSFLLPTSEGGSGVIAELPTAEAPKDFLLRVKKTFGIDCLQTNRGPERMVKRIALCGGAGDFLLDAAIARGADVFLTGEMHYHQYFGHDAQLWIGIMGHYQSEQFTVELLHRLLQQEFPTLELLETTNATNPIQYI
ncbi:Nif3-like dinuclear metal center hexameric protein [Alloprevotella rava]|uniref:GTP cyclohydrolase 1 type 2 homolog n=1 Tax=Alloprevotella rava TaxID=671218 RepID=A0A7W5UEF4_9BACT|nr:Nif3-like dinuclear metal center hexameric protein [Alloprevotella rava]MBB3702543.1 dinuclear metal center YbgI/SA1388 family protein [Alloprevotella rava]